MGRDDVRVTHNRSKKMNTKLFALVITLALAGTAAPAQASGDEVKVTRTQHAVRDLWIDHLFWIRSVVSAATQGDKAARQEADRQVVENARHIAGVIEPFYGTPASEKLFGLLAGHYKAVLDYLSASIPSPAADRKSSAVEKLTANAEEIADFLSSANPYLPRETLLALLVSHGGHHVSQIDQIQAGDFQGEAETWREMKRHIYILSDALVNGIARQFPDRF